MYKLNKATTWILFVFFAIYLGLSNTAIAQEIRGIKLAKTYVPQGFDTNDNAVFVVEGYLPSDCYRIGFLEKKVDGNKITLNQKTYYYKLEGCPRRATYFKQEVFLGVLPEGTYQIVDKNSGTTLDALPVRKASGLTPDDFTYANVLDVSYNEENNIPTVNLELELPNACWYVKEARVELESNDVVTILPIVDKNNSQICTQAVVRLVQKVELTNLQKGKYLIHARSVSGKAVTKLVRVLLQDGEEK